VQIALPVGHCLAKGSSGSRRLVMNAGFVAGSAHSRFVRPSSDWVEIGRQTADVEQSGRHEDV
jgi:hypothetical protein